MTVLVLDCDLLPAALEELGDDELLIAAIPTRASRS